MAVQVIEVSERPVYSDKTTSLFNLPVCLYRKTFLCSSVDDIAKLPKSEVSGTIETDNVEVNDPCAFGSTALVCTSDSSEVYILNPDNNWVMIV